MCGSWWWRKLSSGDGFISVHLEEAKEFILQAVPIRKPSSKTCPQSHMLSLVTTRADSVWCCDSMSQCVGGNGHGEHHQQSVWRCSQDWRVMSGGTCDSDLCGECVKQNVQKGSYAGQQKSRILNGRAFHTGF